MDRLYVERVGTRAQESVIKDGLEAHPVGDLEAFLDRDPVKLLLIGTAGACDAFKADLDAACAADPAPPTVVRSEPEYIEVLAHGAHKGLGLELACAAAGLDVGEVVAVGDGLNDLELLRTAGLGLAPDNAHPELKRAADRVIGHHDTDALGRALAEIFGF
jgi:hydroxymethylpyrimidine pyrophosphatase-like HAD family hydrolase